MKMRPPQRTVTRRVTPVDWNIQRMPSRRDNLRSRQGFHQEQNLVAGGRARYSTPVVKEGPLPPRPPSRKSVYGRPLTRDNVFCHSPVREETDSELSSTEPEWSKGPYPGDLRYGSRSYDYEPGLIPLRRSPGYRTLTRSLGPAPIPCKHPIPYISKSLPNAVSSDVRVVLRVRPGTYVLRRTSPSTPLHTKLMKSKSDETANTSKSLQGVTVTMGVGAMAAVRPPSRAKAAPKVKVTQVPAEPKPGPTKPQPRNANNNKGGRAVAVAKSRKIFAPSALVRMVNAKQIRQDNNSYKERIRNAKPSEQIANAFRRDRGPPKP